MSVLARNSHTSSLHKQQPSPSYDSAYRSAMSDSEGSYSSDFSGSEYDSRSDRSRSPSRSRSRGRRNTRSRSRSFSPSRSRSPAPRATKARGRPTKKPVAPKRSLLKPGAKRRRPEVYGKMPVNSARRRSNVSLHDHCRSLEKQLQELKRENKLLSDIQRRQEKALNKYEGSATELPAVVERKEEEIRVLTEQSRTYRSRAHKAERDVRSEKKKVGRLQESVDKLNKLVKNKGLKEQAALEAQVKSLTDKLKSSEDTIERLQKQLNLAEKSRDRLDREGRKGVKETQDTVKALQAELDLKTQQLVEKEKQLDVMNIRARATSQQVATLKRVKQSPLNASVGKSKKQPKPPSKAKNSTPRRALPVPAASSKRVSPSKPVSKSPAKAKATAPSPKKSPAKKAPVPKSPEPMSDSELSASDDDVDDFEDNSASESEIESDHEEEERQRKLAEQEAREAAEAKRKQEAAAAAKELQRKKDEEEAARKAKETEERLAREAKEAERKRLFEEEKRRGEEEERKRLEAQRRIEEEAERRRLEEERIAAEKEKARLEVERAREERKKKDILLAKMKAMDKSDNGNSLPGSPAVVRKLSTPERTFTKKDVPDWLKSNKKSSPKTYEASDPIKNMHLGRPARPVQSGDSTSSRKLREDILLDTPKPSAGRARGAASKSSSLPWESSNDKPAQPKAAGGLPWENKTNGTAKPAKKESSGGYTPSGFLAPKRGMKGPKKNLPWNKVTPARDFDDDGLEAIAV